MTLDLIFLGLMLAFGLLGWISGFWMQLMRLAVLVGAYLLAGLLGKPFGPLLAEAFGIPLLLGQTVGTFLAFVGTYLILSTVGWSLLRRRRRRVDGEKVARRRAWESLAGCGFGMAKAGLILYVLLCAVTLMEARLAGPMRKSQLGYDNSMMVELSRRHNLLRGVHLPVVGDIESLSRLSNDPGFRQKAAQDPAIQRLINHPKIQGLLGDRSIVQASQSRDVAALMAHPRLNEALEDPEVRELLGQIDLSRVR